MTRHAFLNAYGLFDARVPRYTSYPPATHFTDAATPATTRDWVASVRPGEVISLYLHIPFCRRLCWFCACRTQGTKTDAPLRPYLDALLKELSTLADLLPDGVRLGRLHLGGGTPTILPPDMMRELGWAIAARLPDAPGAERSIEIDPTVLDDARLDALADIGITRASMGVQDFAPRVQRAIGRPQTLAQTRAAVDGLRARGIAGLNLDLLYGLPFQTGASLRRTLDAALDLKPQRIAMFGYAHVPWASKRQVMIPTEALPDPHQRLDLFELAGARLRQAGLVAIGIDHFARPDDGLVQAARAGQLRRNFQGYTDDMAETLIGLGASSISRFRQGYAQNDPTTSGWARAVTRGGLATTRGHVFAGRDRLHAAAIEALLCDFAIDPAILSDRTGAEAGAIEALLSGLAADWSEVLRPGAGGRVEIAPGARPLVRLIAASLDRYATGRGQYSLAV